MPTTADRVQLALHVPDLEAAIDFYSAFFDATPHKVRPGYANFAIASPPLKLVLIEDPSRRTGLDHLGIERVDVPRVAEEAERLAGAGLAVRHVDGVVCCHARQDKHYASDPGGLEWENYTVTDDDPELPADHDATLISAACCD